MKTVKDILDRDEEKLFISTVFKDDSIQKAVLNMREYDIGSAIVIDATTKRVAGIFTERDVVTKCIKNDEFISIKDTPIGDYMTKNIIVVKEDTYLSECIACFRDKGFRHLPVVDKNKKLIGVLSIKDFLPFVVVD